MKEQIYFWYGAKIPPIDLSVQDLFLSSLAILLYFVLMFSFLVILIGDLRHLEAYKIWCTSLCSDP